MAPLSRLLPALLLAASALGMAFPQGTFVDALTPVFATTAAPSARAVASVNNKGQPTGSDTSLDLSDTQTDAGTIVDTANQVEQKSSPPLDAQPDLPPADTVVTAIDGNIVQTNSSSTRRRFTDGLIRRSRSDYTQVFDGSGTGVDDRDCSIEGTAYMTYTVVSNSTYSVDDCLSFCDRTQGCGTCLCSQPNLILLMAIQSLRQPVLRAQQPTSGLGVFREVQLEVCPLRGCSHSKGEDKLWRTTARTTRVGQDYYPEEYWLGCQVRGPRYT
jgi:hypothetical protein